MNSGTPLLINADTKIRDLLKVNEDLVIDALVELNKNFSKLHNPLLKKLFAGRVTISHACRVGGVSVDDFLACMKSIGFVTDQNAKSQSEVKAAPDNAIHKEHAVELDVRPILAGGKDPLKIILQEIGKLDHQQSLKLINTFEPIPLYHLLAEKGYTYQTENPAPDTFITWFQKAREVPEPAVAVSADQSRSAFDERLNAYEEGMLLRIDVRSLEMPKPMLLILEKVDELDEQTALFVYHKKVPVYLLPQLKEKGFEYAIKPLEDGDVQILIYKV